MSRSWYAPIQVLLLILSPWFPAGVVSGQCLDEFEGNELSTEWTASTVLSQGEGAKPGYRVSEGRLIWGYESGTQNAQQQVLLRNDVLPTVGQTVMVHLRPEEYGTTQQDFAGLALSTVGPKMADRVGLVIFYYEPAPKRLRFWYFRDKTKDLTAAHEVALDLADAEALVLRLARVGEERVRAAWSTDGEQFHWMPVIRVDSIRAVGVYNGNGRNPSGNRLSFDGFQIVHCELPDTSLDYELTTPNWTHPTEFLPAEGTGGPLAWPRVQAAARPGAYWWWPGSAVSKEDLTWNLETYRKAGWGNMGAIGIYGVRGEEDRFLDIFSPQWFEMYNHAVTEAERLGMNIDLTPSSGWRMGGPHVTPEYAEQSFAVTDGQIVAKQRNDRVKRAGPGGTGLTINPYSEAAVKFHIDWMNHRFAEGKGKPPRAFYYDSFENPGNWCPELLHAFRQLRGYSLEEHAEAMAGQGDSEESRRVVCDYRETLSDLLIGRVNQFVRWGKEQGSGLRMQAHGAPANLLDMYAAAEIPETEVFGASILDIPGYRRDPALIRPDRQSDLVNRFSSSAAHVAGRDVVISESFTWLRNHYHTALSHIKAESDKLLLNGINCIYYHGICFSPKETTWPGWLFYASTEANARNSIFRDVPILNAYITRCQSVLQEGAPHNDVLLYWPVYDLWMSGGTGEKRFSVHHPEWIDETPCGQAGRWMMDKGYTFDFVSDKQLQEATCQDGVLRTSGSAEYRTVLVPAAKAMKVDTARRLIKLAEAGATILVWQTLPQDVPGWKDHTDRRTQLEKVFATLALDESGAADVGTGKVILGDDLPKLLKIARIAREPMVDHGLQFIRRKTPSYVSYFIANHTAEPVDAWLPVAAPCRSALLMDPMTARKGAAPVRLKDGVAKFYVQMQPGETRVLRSFADQSIEASDWPIAAQHGRPLNVPGPWRVQFVDGGPELPAETTTEDLKCWTALGIEEAERFAGAARYSTTLQVPDSEADRWLLDLGDVRESARVWVNGRPAGAVVAHPFRVDVSDLLKPGINEIVVEVTNLSANRVRDLDRRGVDWKKFHDINFVDHMYKPFDASGWKTKPSGLLGPVTLVPHRTQDETTLP